MFFVQDHLHVVDLNIAPQNIPKKNTKYLRTSKCGFCRHDVVFFPGFAIQVPFFVLGGGF